MPLALRYLGRLDHAAGLRSRRSPRMPATEIVLARDAGDDAAVVAHAGGVGDARLAAGSITPMTVVVQPLPFHFHISAWTWTRFRGSGPLPTITVPAALTEVASLGQSDGERSVLTPLTQTAARRLP